MPIPIIVGIVAAVVSAAGAVGGAAISSNAAQNLKDKERELQEYLSGKRREESILNFVTGQKGTRTNLMIYLVIAMIIGVFLILVVRAFKPKT